MKKISIILLSLILSLLCACTSDKTNAQTEDDNTTTKSEETSAAIDSTSKTDVHVWNMTDDQLIELLESGGFDFDSNTNPYGLPVETYKETILGYAKECSLSSNFTCHSAYSSNYPEAGLKVIEVIRNHEGYVDSGAWDVGDLEFDYDELNEMLQRFWEKVQSVITYELPAGVSVNNVVAWFPWLSAGFYDESDNRVGGYYLDYFPVFKMEDGVVNEFNYWADGAVLNDYYQYDSGDDAITVVANITTQVTKYESAEDLEGTTVEKTYYYVFFLRTDSYIYHSIYLDASLYTEEDLIKIVDSVELSEDAFTLNINALAYVE